MTVRRGIHSSIVLIVALAVALGSGVAAEADPPAGQYRQFVGVGARADANLWEALSSGTPAVDYGRPQIPSVASYSAATAARQQIRTRAGGPLSARPGFDLIGLITLSQAHYAPYLGDVDDSYQQKVNVRGQVDFARMPTRPTSDLPGTDLTWMPFVRDAISVVGQGLDPRITSLTRAELQALYQCRSAGHISAARGMAYVGDGFRQELHPTIPSGENVQTAFANAAGIEEYGSCVPLYPASRPENNGAIVTQVGEIQPFAVSSWIAQKNGVATDTVDDPGLRLLAINGVAPTSARAPALMPGPLFGASAVVPAPGSFAHDIYNVIDHTGVGTPLETALTTAAGTGLSRTVINRFGFKNLDYLGDRSQYLTSGHRNF
ncbi:hypothetical protein [Glaciihabitans sp. dw_435]|uniref:hypothetical protein n=1 Tax=Glaciihabitans sp. dw_435 TaxID=2720081 RepID=UPI001BD5CEC4|nr:hypothetical protein [Glaciihabitans sp. dw_435]